MRSEINQVLSGHIKKVKWNPDEPKGVPKLVRYKDVSLYRGSYSYIGKGRAEGRGKSELT